MCGKDDYPRLHTLSPVPMASKLDPETARLLFDRLMQSLPDQVYFKDTEGRFICVNQAQAKFLGAKTPEEVVGKTDFDFFPRDLAEIKDADERAIVSSGKGFVGKEENSTPIGSIRRWCLTSKVPLVGPDGKIIGTFGISRDITEIKEAREALNAQNRLLRTLIEILPCRIFVKDREGRLKLTNEAYRRAFNLSSEADVVGRRLDDFVNSERVKRFAEHDREVIEKGISILNLEDYDPEHGPEHWLLVSRVPLRDADGNVEGVVGMAADITAQKEAEARALKAQQELEAKNRQIETELLLAGELQTELMASSIQSVREELDPAAPYLPQIHFHYQPSIHLAGDFFQVLPISENAFGLLICDVMGHGVKAALVTTLIRGLLVDLRADELSPAEVLGQLNARLCALLDRPPLPRFVTALYAHIDTRTGTVRVANAGHPWPLWQRGERAAQLNAEECDPALGLIPDTEYRETSRKLQKGDRLLVYTDGWIEEINASGEEYGRERMLASLAATAGLSADAVLPAMTRDLSRFAGDAIHEDDLCAVLACF